MTADTLLQELLTSLPDGHRDKPGVARALELLKTDEPAAGEPLRAVADDYLGARCGLPNCGHALHIVWTLGKAIYLSNTVAELADPRCSHTSTWHVECEGGHTILTPPDTADDSYTFGECRCDIPSGGAHLEGNDGTCTDECVDRHADHESTRGEDGHCGHGDLDRLRAILDPRAVLYWSTRDGQRWAKSGDRKFVITECTDPQGDGLPWEVVDARPGIDTKVDYFPTLTAAHAECELRAGMTA